MQSGALFKCILAVFYSSTFGKLVLGHDGGRTSETQQRLALVLSVTFEVVGARSDLNAAADVNEITR